MEIVSANSLIDKALKEYHAVLDELNRPQEDLVMVAACELVKRSISDFLAAFLTEKGEEVTDREDILTLQKQCAGFDRSFEELDYSGISCLNEESSMVYTNALEDSRLTRYVDTLKQTKELVLNLTN